MLKKIFLGIIFTLIIFPLSVEASSFFSPNARLVKQPDDNKIYLVVEGKRHHVRNLNILRSYPGRKIQTISNRDFSETEPVRLIKSPLGPRVYLLDSRSGQKVWFPTEKSFVDSKENWNNIVEISGVDSLGFDNARLIKDVDDPKVYEINYQTLEKRHIKTEAEFVERGFNWNKIVSVPTPLLNAFTEVDEFSADIPELPRPPEEEVEPPTDDPEKPEVPTQPIAQVTVSQRFMTPTLFASGTSHNVVQRIVFTAGTGPVTIQGLNLTRKGFLLDEDYESVALVDDVGFLLAEPKQPNRARLNFSFADSFRIEPRQTRVITVVTSFKRELTNGGQLPVGFSLESPADVISNNQISGDFPIIGQLHRVTPAANLIGSLQVSPDPGFSVGNLVVGEKDVELNAFTFEETSGVEDVAIHRIIVTLSGSLQISDFTNFELVDERNRVVASRPVIKGQKMAFVPANPYLIEANDEQTFRVRADVVGGVDRVGVATIENFYDIRAVGQRFNYSLSPLSGTGSFPIGRDGRVEVEAGTVSLNISKDTPTGGLPRGGDSVVLTRFEVRPGSQDLYWRNANLKIVTTTGATPLSGNIWIRYKGGETIGMVNAANVHNSIGSINFNAPVLSANKVYVFEIVTDISNSLRVGDGYRAILSSAEFRVVNSNNNLIFAGEITGAQRAIQEITLLIRNDTRFTPGIPVAGRTNFEVGRFILKPSAGENVVIKEIVLESVGSSNQFIPGFSNYNFSGSRLVNPAGERARFEFNKSIRTGSEAVFGLSLDTTSSADGVTISYEVVSVRAVGATSGAVVEVDFGDVVTPEITFKETVLELSQTEIAEGDKLINGKAVLGAFMLTADSVEDIDISAFTIVESSSSDGISITDGYSNLRIERASDRRAVTRVVASPVGGQGGDRLTSGPRITTDMSEKFYIVADATDPVGDTVQVGITLIEARGRSSRLVPRFEGLPITLNSVTF